ncbi:hypothetical protein CW354_08365 [Marinicaulis flavus]|uniref:Uncharacterized protein n=1 Tax=Hyphococcus luteus TaxID=2058213 RepID=A0A2S7K714_9PROT|nr:hypothetical protein CW354_08365 [Marinicaulis flavus]
MCPAQPLPEGFGESERRRLVALILENAPRAALHPGDHTPEVRRFTGSRRSDRENPRRIRYISHRRDLKRADLLCLCWFVVLHRARDESMTAAVMMRPGHSFGKTLLESPRGLVWKVRDKPDGAGAAWREHAWARATFAWPNRQNVQHVSRYEPRRGGIKIQM